MKKCLTEPINWKTLEDRLFQNARPIPLLEAVKVLESGTKDISQISVVGKVFRRWPFYCDITGRLNFKRKSNAQFRSYIVPIGLIFHSLNFDAYIHI